MPTAATVTSKGQVTIPASLRSDMQLEAGDRLVFTRLEDGTVIMRKETRSFNDLKGLIKTGDKVPTERIDEWVAEARTAIGSGG